MSTHHLPRIAALLALLACAFLSTAQAQIWQGPAALEIRAEGKGSLSGATVELEYLALDPPDGPPPVTLDSRGRAVVGGLAEGMWRVSVRREGFMTYQAEVDVRRDDKPELVATFQQNVPGAVHMMKVKIARAKPSGPPAVPPPPQIAERPAPRPAEPTPAPRATPEPAAPPREQPTPPVPVPQAPPQQPEPQAQPAPPVTEPPRPATPEPAPTRPAPVPTPAPPVTDPVPPVHSDPEAEPAPAAPQPIPPSRVPPPQAQPAPPAPAAPGGSVLRRSYADRTCYECKPGEASLSVERVVAPGVGCGPVGRDLLAHSGDSSGLPEGCAVLRVSLPAGARYTGYRYEIQERSGSVDCLAGRDCPGGGRWPVDPALDRSSAGTTISAAFENLGSGNDRRAILTVYYSER